METVLYLEVYAICMAVLIVLLVKSGHDTDRLIENKLFSAVICAALAADVCDCVWKLVEDGIFPGLSAPGFWNALINALYFTLVGFVGFLWLVYSEYRRGSRWMNKKWLLLISLVPEIALACFSFLSLSNGWVFFVDANNVYHRGSLYFIQPLVGFSYIILAALIALISGLLSKSYPNRQVCRTLASFAVFPIVCGALQTIFQFLPALCVGITISLLIVFITFQDRRISLDPFTQLNNRNHLMRYLAAKLPLPANASLCLVMLDIDKFKRINDTYGHLEGDAALLQLSAAMKKCCSSKNCFLARYGGDEFALVYDGDLAQAKQLMRDIHQALDDIHRNSGSLYPFTVSMGCVACTSKTSTVETLVSAADEALYAQKRAKKETAIWI